MTTLATECDLLVREMELARTQGAPSYMGDEPWEVAWDRAIAIVRQRYTNSPVCKDSAEQSIQTGSPSTYPGVVSGAWVNFHNSLHGAPSEIRSPLERDLYLKISDLMLTWKRGENLYETGWAIVNAIRPHLRTTEPVSVNLAICANAALQADSRCDGDTPPTDLYREISKAVLDAAGVKYE